MYVARRGETDAWLIPDAFRSQFESMGFARFDDPPSDLSEVSHPVLFSEAVPSKEQVQLSRPSVAAAVPAVAATLAEDKPRSARKRGR